ncbi:M23 family metallopeptidase [Sphingorhabdus arenilitoris]|uniref:M23 family metallopeptidase n=1 Tax=Sphingorhabdus arenilitoris TaxID=1490041 RepID=A0ABV8RCT4_9SPHN
MVQASGLKIIFAAALFSLLQMPFVARASDKGSDCANLTCISLPSARNAKEAAEINISNQDFVPKTNAPLVEPKVALPSGNKITHTPRYELGRYVRPVDIIRISSAFGMRYDPALGHARLHAGIDIPGRYASPIYAIEAGYVEYAASAGTYGLLVRLRHDSNIETRYAHLSRIAVSRGTYVESGQIIGYMGSTGRSTGNHLHFEVRQNGVPLEPTQFLASGGRQPAFSGLRSDAAEVKPHQSEFSRKVSGKIPDNQDASLR